jgi:hypothetical protein
MYVTVKSAPADKQRVFERLRTNDDGLFLA